MPRVRLLISGLVQGIGFRYWLRQKMAKLGLSGWVRNNPDGTVEAELAGNEAKVRQIVELCHQGPPLARVDKVAILK